MGVIMGVMIWLGKNLGLVIGIAEIIVQAIGDIIVQIIKAAAGIVNVLQPSRQKDALVKFVEKLEVIHTGIDIIFTNVKKWLYKFGVPATQ